MAKTTKVTKNTKTTGTTKTTKQTINFEERDRLISETAYYLACERNFENGDELDDWYKAAEIIDKKYFHRSTR